MTVDRGPIEKIVGVPSSVLRRIERDLGGRYQRWRLGRHSTHDALDPAVAIRDFRSADRVLFLCLGNICRSPFAARYFRDRAPDSADVAVASAGLSPYSGIESPLPAVEVAEGYGIDLRDHRSTRVTGSLTRRSDLVFVMDFRNYHLVATRHPEALDSTRFLGAIAEDGTDIAISDPHHQGIERFEHTFARIARTIDHLLDATVPGQPLEGDEQ